MLPTAMSELWGPQRKFSTWRRLWVALAEAEAELGLPVTPRANRRAQAARRRHRLRRRRSGTSAGCGTTSWPTSMPTATSAPGPADHPPGRDKLLRDRQHRPDPAPRGAGTGPRPARGRDRRPGPLRPGSIAPCPAWPSRTCSRPSRRRSANGPACGPTISCSTWPKSSSAWQTSRPTAARARPARRPASWNCSTAIMKRSAGWTS